MDAALPSGATSHDFFHRARARLTLDVPAALDDPTVEATRGDLDLDPAMWEQAGVKATRPAAVLVPVVDRSEPTVLLTLRTELPSHPGQIAFPGGKIEPQDHTPAEAALREAAEEIGLARALIEPIGYLDLYLTFSGYRVVPVVARVRPDYRLTLNAAEVALLAEFDEIVEQRARHLRPEVAPHVEIGLEPAGLSLALEPQRVIAVARHPVVDVGAEMQHPAVIGLLGPELDREERRVVDDDPAFLDRRDQEVFVPFPLEDRGEELHQRRPPDRSLEIEPGAVRSDAHIEVAAKRRIPQMHRRRPFAHGVPRHARDGVQPAPCLFRLLRHGSDPSSE